MMLLKRDSLFLRKLGSRGFLIPGKTYSGDLQKVRLASGIWRGFKSVESGINGFSPRYESAANLGVFDLWIRKVPLSSHLRLLAREPIGSKRGKSAGDATVVVSDSTIGLGRYVS